MAKEFLSDVDLKAGLLLNGSAGTSGQVLQSQGAGQKPIWATASGSGSVTIGASAADILDASSGTITADDAGSDKIVFWDDSAGKLTYLTPGAGLAINGTTLDTDSSMAAGYRLYLHATFI